MKNFFCILAFLGCSLILSCNKGDTLSTDALGINGYSQIVFSLNGKLMVKKYGIDSSNIYSSFSNSVNDSLYSFIFSVSYPIDSADSISITAGTITATNAITVDDGNFDNFFSPGSKIYAALTENMLQTVNGVEINYIQNGTIWSSTENVGNNQYSVHQNGHAFYIDDDKPVENFLGHHTVKVTGHFDCTLYQAGNPADTMQLQNAAFVAFFTNN